jgi:hypothetical protein
LFLLHIVGNRDIAFEYTKKTVRWREESLSIANFNPSLRTETPHSFD